MKKDGWQSQVGIRDWWDRLMWRLDHSLPPSKAKAEEAWLKWGFLCIGAILGALAAEALGFFWVFWGSVGLLFLGAAFKAWRSPPE